VDADEATATPHVLLERGLLPVVQDIAGGIQEYDGAIAAQVVVSELLRIGADVDAELVVTAKVLDRAGAFPDRCVSFAGGPGEHEDAKLLHAVGVRPVLGAVVLHAVQTGGLGVLIQCFGSARGQQRTRHEPGCGSATITSHLDRLSRLQGPHSRH